MRQIAICAVVSPNDWVPRYIFQAYHPHNKFKTRRNAGDFRGIEGEARLVILREVDDLDGPQTMREDVERFREGLYAVPKKFHRPCYRPR